MAAQEPQSFANHARVVPGFHYGVFGILAINLLWSGWRLFRTPGMDSVMGLLLALGLVGLAWYTRTFPLAAQDRVIRLEMQLRLRDLLPGDLRARLGELTARQLIALRFASDAELPELVRAVLTEGIRDGKAIKRRIKGWQADHLRV